MIRRLGNAPLLAALVLLAVPVPVPAQRDQPIYPTYDGYLQNPDGSYTISFGYFSHNAQPVDIPIGAQNSFTPGPADRGQAVTFLNGTHRFQCVMVVGADFDGKTRWNLSYGGTTTGTSQNMLQSNYNLVEGAAELRRIDFAKAPRGVCLNRAPNVSILGSSARGARLNGTVKEPVSLFGSVSDEGLPRPPAKVTAAWKKVSGPGDVRFEDASAPRTHATFSVPGAYELELSASDSVLTDTVRVAVTVK